MSEVHRVWRSRKEADQVDLQHWVTTGDLIRVYRGERGLTLEQMEKLSGYSPSYISQLENGGRKNPSLNVLRRIAPVLGVGLGDLMGPTEALYRLSTPPFPNTTKLRVQQYYRALSTDYKAWLQASDPTQPTLWLLSVLNNKLRISVEDLAATAKAKSSFIRCALEGTTEPRVIWGVLISAAIELSPIFIREGILEDHLH